MKHRYRFIFLLLAAMPCTVIAQDLSLPSAASQDTTHYGLTRRQGAGVQPISLDRAGQFLSPFGILRGQVAGLQVTDLGGAPGAAYGVRLHGGISAFSTNPLVVLDGMPLPDHTFDASISLSDIASATFLKEGAVAMYGSRAANGVLLLTSKQGGQQGPRLEYRAIAGVASPHRLLDMMDANTYRDYVMQRYSFDSEVYNSMGTAQTDWQGEALRPALQTGHHLSFSDQWKTLPYRVAAGYDRVGGTLKESGLQRFNTALSLSPSFLGGRLRTRLSMRYSRADYDYVDERSFERMALQDPTQPLSPALLPLDTDKGSGQTDRLNAILALSYQLSEAWNLHLEGGYDRWSRDVQTNSFIAWLSPSYIRESWDNGRTQRHLNAYVHYRKTAGLHAWQLRAGTSLQREERTGSWQQLMPLGQARGHSINASYSGYFAYGDYTFDGRYRLEAGMRLEDNDRDLAGNTLKPFYASSFALGWDMKKDLGIERLDALDMRLSYMGTSLAWEPLYGEAYMSYGSYRPAYYQLPSGAYPTIDPRLSLYGMSVTELSLQTTAWGGRFKAGLSLYRRHLTDLPVYADTPSAQMILIARDEAINQQGATLRLEALLLDTPGLKWRLSADGSYVSQVLYIHPIDNWAYSYSRAWADASLPGKLWNLHTELRRGAWSLNLSAHAQTGGMVFAQQVYWANASVGGKPANYAWLSDSRQPKDYLFSADFLRIDYLGVGYDFGQLGKMHLRLEAAAQNLALLSSYKGGDPERFFADASVRYPRPTTLTLGVQASW